MGLKGEMALWAETCPVGLPYRVTKCSWLAPGLPRKGSTALLGCPGLYRSGFFASGAWARDTSRQRSRGRTVGMCCCTQLQVCLQLPLGLCPSQPEHSQRPCLLSTPGPAQRPSLLFDPSVTPCPRAFAFSCHLCGHVSVNRLSLTLLFISLNTWCGICLCSHFFSFSPLLPHPFLPLPLNGSVTSISLQEGKEGKQTLISAAEQFYEIWPCCHWKSVCQ